MSDRALELLKPLIEDLIGGSTFTFEAANNVEENTDNKYSKTIRLNNINYVCSVSRIKLRPIHMEKRLFEHTLA